MHALFPQASVPLTQPPGAWRRLGARLGRCDARLFQIAFLATLLSIGVLLRDFSLKPEQMALTFAAGLATQWLWVRHLHLKNVGLLSAAITCFGLSILLRADTLWVHPLIATAAISAKFLLRINGKHVYNPANLGVILATTLLPGAWISPGQWGNDLAYALWFVALGGLVVQRARRMDISWMFLGCFLGLCIARFAWLGVPLARGFTLLSHQTQSGALLLFAFFMISDPMTIPNRTGARLFYAAAVALAAFLWQFYLYRPNGLIWALFLLTPMVPLLDRLLPGARHQWRPAAGLPASRQKGDAVAPAS
ncbi:MAG TPA: RnfABCDGE type electron transport complex subunit D [Burkholderiales bacterium]|nr:RnfABCDGE type electron transport complex subunit D [Burkholderiales bacterium]